MQTSPCKDCVAPKRYPGCHSVCKEYIGWKAERDEVKARAKESETPALSDYSFSFPAGKRRYRRR